MWAYLSRRLVATFAILIGITMVTYCLTYIVPADPIRQMLGRNATAQMIENVTREKGLDRPLPEQYARYVWDLAHGDLGRSYIQKIQVSDLVLSRLPATLLLMAGAIFFELLIGIPAGIFAATRRGRPLDRWIMMFSFAGVSAPQFVVGLLLLYIFSNLLSLFPMGGYGTLSHLILPALTLGIAGGGWYARMMRSSMVDVLRQDYVRTAKAKGLGPAKVVLVHAFRNAVLPIIAMIGLDVGFFMSGAVVVESVYGWPGIGQLAWMGIQRLDTPIIMGVTLVAALGILIGNLVADLITPLIDPRIRLR
jgi:peptide/nickel transport system permease protein